MQDAYTVERQLQRIRANLREDRLQALADGGGADRNRYYAVPTQFDAGIFFRSGRATFDEAANSDAVIAPARKAAGELRFRPPIELRQANIESRAIIAAVIFRFGF